MDKHTTSIYISIPFPVQNLPAQLYVIHSAHLPYSKIFQGHLPGILCLRCQTPPYSLTAFVTAAGPYHFPEQICLGFLSVFQAAIWSEIPIVYVNDQSTADQKSFFHCLTDLSVTHSRIRYQFFPRYPIFVSKRDVILNQNTYHLPGGSPSALTIIMAVCETPLNEQFLSPQKAGVATL